MGKSQESYNKKEKEKKRLKKRKEKRELREQRKAEREEAGPKSFEDMISYVDGDGNLTKTKPDPKDLEINIELEDIIIGAPPRSDDAMDPIRIGRAIKENDHVSFEVEMGQKGPNAVRVKHHDPNAKPKPKPEDVKKEEAKVEEGNAEAPKEEAKSEDVKSEE